jgi:hypothetical protein
MKEREDLLIKTQEDAQGRIEDFILAIGIVRPGEESGGLEFVMENYAKFYDALKTTEADEDIELDMPIPVEACAATLAVAKLFDVVGVFEMMRDVEKYEHQKKLEAMSEDEFGQFVDDLLGDLDDLFGEFIDDELGKIDASGIFGSLFGQPDHPDKEE